jgi:Probable transposase
MSHPLVSVGGDVPCVPFPVATHAGPSPARSRCGGGSALGCHRVLRRVEPRPLPATGTAVGIDVGVANLVATSDGELVANPRLRRGLAAKLAAAQRDRARGRPGSHRDRQAKQTVARLKAKEATSGPITSTTYRAAWSTATT